MKFNEENIKKLRDGKATLVANHSNPEDMDMVLREAFLEDPDTYDNTQPQPQPALYYVIHPINCSLWACSSSDRSIIGELINLTDFFEQEMTEEQRDKEVKRLQEQIKGLSEIDFSVKLPTELIEFPCEGLTDKEYVLIQLLRMRDEYRQGWVQNVEKDIYIIYLSTSKVRYFTIRGFKAHVSSIFSFQNTTTADLFLSTFKEELETVKGLIS